MSDGRLRHKAYDERDEKWNRAIEHGNMLGFDSALCTDPKSGRQISKYPAQGYKGWDPQRLHPTLSSLAAHDLDSDETLPGDGNETGRKVARCLFGGGSPSGWQQRF